MLRHRVEDFRRAMDNCLHPDPEEQEKRATARKIDEQIKKAKGLAKKTHKLLLLGTGDSGKTTFVKQMKILYGGGFTPFEIQTYTVDIINNLIDGMRALIEGMKKLGIMYEGGETMESLAKDLISSKHTGGEVTLGPGVASIIARLWEDPGVKKCFAQRNKLQIPDSLGIFLDDLERIIEEGFTPTEMDILLSRKQSTGVVEHEFQMDDHTLVYVDVAGQRGERRKWMHHFEQITAVIFLTAVSEYNQVLWEDNNVNRIIESKQLFQDLLINPYFLDTCFIVFFNKKDLFEEKIKHVSLKKYFPSYEGRDNNAEEAIKFIKGLFTAGERKNRIYPFDTVAINKENAKMVSRSVQDIIFNRIINEAPVV